LSVAVIRGSALVSGSYPSVESVEVKDYGEEVRSIDSFRQSFMVFQLTKIAKVWECLGSKIPCSVKWMR